MLCFASFSKQSSCWACKSHNLEQFIGFFNGCYSTESMFKRPIFISTQSGYSLWRTPKSCTSIGVFLSKKVWTMKWLFACLILFASACTNCGLYFQFAYNSRGKYWLAGLPSAFRRHPFLFCPWYSMPWFMPSHALRSTTY